MCKQLKGQKGFTLIELMIVVAIIGILAAIAIPNFLTYQLKSRQAEAKTNLQAIKTSEVAFQAERGCYIGMGAYGVVAPAAALKSAPFTWGVGPNAGAATVPAVGWCIAGGTFSGQFTDIGPSYHAAIFYGNDGEKKIAEASKNKLSSSGKFKKPVVTEILPAMKFYPAEANHQKYYQQNPEHFEAFEKGSGRVSFQRKTWDDGR